MGSAQCYYFCFLFLPFLTAATTNVSCNITPGSSLTSSSTSAWNSPSGDFAFGFRQIPRKQQEDGEAGGFLLAIWFDKTPEKTIVWSANHDNLVPPKSTVHLSKDGSLVLTSPNLETPIWTAGGGAACAAMRDDGNFVLLAGNKDGSSNAVHVWQSFDHPTDTLLPTQTMIQGTRLVSKFTETNFSRGRFQFPLQSDGNLVLYTMNFPLDAVNFPYWASSTDGEKAPELVFSETGALYLKARNGTILRQIFKNSDPTTGGGSYYQRVVLEYDGVLVQYLRRKNPGGGNWSAVGFIPENICTRITQDTGGGVCGFNGYCSIADENGARPICKCPPGYERLDPDDEMGGCRPGFEPQRCDGGGVGEYELREMVNTDWPLSDYEHYKGVSEEWCGGECLRDCFCAVAIHRDGDCWKKRMPVSNGRFDPRVGGKALIKVRKHV